MLNRNKVQQCFLILIVLIILLIFLACKNQAIVLDFSTEKDFNTKTLTGSAFNFTVVAQDNGHIGLKWEEPSIPTFHGVVITVAKEANSQKTEEITVPPGWGMSSYKGSSYNYILKNVSSYSSYNIRFTAVWDDSVTTDLGTKTVLTSKDSTPPDSAERLLGLAFDKNSKSIIWEVVQSFDAEELEITVSIGNSVLLSENVTYLAGTFDIGSVLEGKTGMLAIKIKLIDINGNMQSEAILDNSLTFEISNGEMLGPAPLALVALAAEAKGISSDGTSLIDKDESLFISWVWPQENGADAITDLVMSIEDASSRQSILDGKITPNQSSDVGEFSGFIKAGVEMKLEQNSVALTGLYGIGKYSIKAKTFRNAQYSTEVTASGVTTDTKVPALTEAVGSHVTISTITLEWSPPKIENVFLLPDYQGVKLILKNTEGAVVESATVKDAIEYTFGGLFPNTEYAIEILVFDLAGNISTSTNVKVLTRKEKDMIAPGIFDAYITTKIYLIKSTEATVEFSWSSDDADINHYEFNVQTKNTGEETEKLKLPAKGNSIVERYLKTGLSPGKEYIATITPVDRAGNKGVSIQITSLRIPEPVEASDLMISSMEVPSSGENFIISTIFAQSPDSLANAHSRDAGMLEYKLQILLDDTEVAVKSLLGTEQEIAFTVDDGLKAHKTYTFKFSIFDRLNSYISEKRTYTVASPTPRAPAAVNTIEVIGATTTSVSLRWDAPADTGADNLGRTLANSALHYKIEVGITGSSGTPVLMDVGQGTSYTVPNLVAETTYTFVVYSCNFYATGFCSSDSIEAATSTM